MITTGIDTQLLAATLAKGTILLVVADPRAGGARPGWQPGPVAVAMAASSSFSLRSATPRGKKDCHVSTAASRVARLRS